ncbi:MAG TPA: hypothetical protein VG889_04150 [Rhizomicrobium sp.]|nr:hypothetical protein [Rhizomicrobium sp.]
MTPPSTVQWDRGDDQRDRVPVAAEVPLHDRAYQREREAAEDEGVQQQRLVPVARRGRPILPLPLIALVTHWLLGNGAAKPEAIAEALVAATRALAASLLRVKA